MEISDVILNRTAVPCMCYGKTRRGRRCKLKSKNTYRCYGVEMTVCKYHEKQNVIFDWSHTRRFVHVPEKVRTFLYFYGGCVKLGLDVWVSLMITAELFTTVDIPTDRAELMELFCSKIFTIVHGTDECSVCYDVKDVMVQTRCKHIFCRECLSQWTCTNITCPMCRTIISQE